MDLPIKPSRFFVGSTMELFGVWNLWMDEILSLCRKTPEHTFIFLTKCPQNLIKLSPFPKNCYVGVTVTELNPENTPLAYLRKIQATVKFISFEPLLKWTNNLPTRLSESLTIANISWVIIGQQTPVSRKTMPRIKWIKDIIEACDKADIPIFLKNNLKPLFQNVEEPSWLVGWCNKPGELRQEFPKN